MSALSFIKKRFSKRNEIIDLFVYRYYRLCDDIFEIKCHVTMNMSALSFIKKTFF